MPEWKIFIRVLSMTGSHEPFEEEFNDAIPDTVMTLLLSGRLRIVVRGVTVYGNAPVVDFKSRRLWLEGESANQVPA